MCALFPYLSLSQSHIWGFDKYFYSEVNKRTSGMFLYEVVPLRWHTHLGSLYIFCYKGLCSLQSGLGELSGMLSYYVTYLLINHENHKLEHGKADSWR